MKPRWGVRRELGKDNLQWRTTYILYTQPLIHESSQLFFHQKVCYQSNLALCRDDDPKKLSLLRYITRTNYTIYIYVISALNSRDLLLDRYVYRSPLIPYSTYLPSRSTYDIAVPSPLPFMTSLFRNLKSRKRGPWG